MAQTSNDFGVIRPEEIYRKDEFFRRVGIKQAGYRTARRNGLKVIAAQGRVFVRGSDWIAYLDSLNSVDA